MGRMYSAAFSGQAETAQCDLLEIVAGSADVVLIHELGISQLADVSDAEEEMLLLSWMSGQTATGSGGNTTSIHPLMLGSVASGATVKDTNTTKASGGTIITHYNWYWNVRIPFQHIFTPETRPLLIPSRRATLELGTTPADELTLAGYIVFEELG